MPKVEHQTPQGFRRHVEPGSSRVTYSPDTAVLSTHMRFLRQVREHPLYFSDPLREVRKHVHLKHRCFLTTDLKSAFDQVTAKRLHAALKWRGINPGWLIPPGYFFHETGRGGLIQGAPSSPYLFETYCRYGGLDWDLDKYCAKLGFHYSRYVDDILISSARILGKRVGPTVRKIVGKYGFSLNDRKTKRVDVYTEPLAVLGYVIRGSRIDPNLATLEPLFDPETSDAARTGLFAWRRHVRHLGRHR